MSNGSGAQRKLSPGMCCAGRSNPQSTAGDVCGDAQAESTRSTGLSEATRGLQIPPPPFELRPPLNVLQVTSLFPLQPCRPGSVSFLRRAAPPSSSFFDPITATRCSSPGTLSLNLHHYVFPPSNLERKHELTSRISF